MTRTTILLGDIHGKLLVINRFMNKYKLTDIDIIQVGDFGIGFYGNDPREIVKEYKRLKNLSDFLGNRNSHLYVMRGNHDDPKFFDGKFTKHKNITFLKDYIPFSLNGKKFLPIGGAISIDKGENPYDTRKNIGRKKKKGRTVNIDWWADEVIKYNPSILNKLRGIDIVLTHSAPHFTKPYGIGKIPPEYSNEDGKLLTSVLEERNQLAKLYDVLIKHNNPKYWFYGHFHQSNITKFDNITLIGLDINEFYELKREKMTNENFIKGVMTISKGMPESHRTQFNVVAEHDQIWLGEYSWVTDEKEIKILNEMGWFEDNGAWSCFV